MKQWSKFLLLPTVALLLAAATQQASAQCSRTTTSKIEEPVIEQPIQSSQVEAPINSQSEQSDTVNETSADSTTQITTEQHPHGAIPENATESPADDVATPGKLPMATTIDATLDRAIQQVQKGTKGVKAGAKTVTQAVRALDELLKAFDKEPETVEPR